MKLRLYRTFKWAYTGRVEDLRLGGSNQLALVSYDELQYQDDAGCWQPVSVVEAEKPEHPQAAKERERQKRMEESVAEIFKDSRVMTYDEIVEQNERSILSRLNKKEKEE